MRLKLQFSVILFCSLFFVSSILVNISLVYSGNQNSLNLQKDTFVQTYESHSSIYIEGDENLTAWGFPGSGLIGDPYVIDGYNFTMNIPAIYVLDISLHLLINGCWIQSTGEQIGTGIHFENVTAGRIENCIIIDKTNGIEITQSESCLISNVEITGTTNHAIDIGTSVNCVVSDSYIHHVSNIGIYDSATLTELSGTVIHNTGYGIYSVGENITVDSCEIYNSGTGIRNQAWNSVFNNNTINQCSSNGIYEYQARYDTFTDNRIFDNNNMGIWFIASRTSNVIGNAIFNNSWGIYVDDAFAGDLTVYDNKFGWQTNNVKDDGDYADTYDNGVDTGNAWDDWSGTGNYYIDGLSGGTDHYPSLLVDAIAPSFIASPDDIMMSTFGSEEINWNIEPEEFPSSYTILINGSGTPIQWNGKDVQCTLEGLAMGVYNYTLWIEDLSGNSASDTVFVEVFGFTLDSPSDIIYECGTIGNSISWFATAWDRVNYEIYVNSSLELSADWTDWIIAYNIDNLSLGVHEVEIRVYNSTGHYLSDIVLVEVVDSYDPIISHLGLYYLEVDSLLTLEWTIEDMNPSELILWKNSSIYMQIPWDFPIFSVEIVGDELGTWNYTLEIIDGAGNTASDTAIVVVRDSSPTTSTTTATTTTTTSTTTTSTTTTTTTMPSGTINETQIIEIQNQLLMQSMIIVLVGGLAILSLMINVALVRRVGKGT